MKKVTIAILALQGAFAEHQEVITRLGAEVRLIRKKEDYILPKDGLIIPGGESTTMTKLLNELEIMPLVRDEISRGLHVFGTCAGMILLSKEVVGEENIKRISTMDVTTQRNAYGRQSGSFYTTGTFKGIKEEIPMTFIRAPYIVKCAPEVDVLSVVDGRIVAARQANQLVTAFHPELDKADFVHQYFLDMIG